MILEAFIAFCVFVFPLMIIGLIDDYLNRPA